tara:strand:+ start:11086 stop:15423 length:4338 start_codon:yes stop_codon:yes gene_type:complete
MAQSAQAKEVILEIGEKDSGTSTITTFNQNGTISYQIFGDGCKGDCDEYNGEAPLNANENFDNFNEWYGLKITSFRMFGNTPNNPHYVPLSNPGTVAYGGPSGEICLQFPTTPTSGYLNSQIIRLNMTTADGTDPNFEGMETSTWNSASLTYVNNLKRDYRSDTEQGRMMYLYPKTESGFTTSISLEVLEGHKGVLYLRGPGIDNMGVYLQTKFPSVTNPSEFFEDAFWQNFEGYITPYVHTGAWKYDIGSITYNSQRENIHLSYATSLVAPVNFASVVNNNVNFGLRSSHELFECRNADTQGYHIKLTIDSIQGCELEVLTYLDYTSIGTYVNQGGYDINDIQYALDYENIDSNQKPWAYKTITTPGTYEFCVPFIPDMCIYEEMQHNPLGFSNGTPGGWSTNVKVQTAGNAFDYKHYYEAQYHFLRVKETSSSLSTLTMSKFEIKEGGTNWDYDVVPTYLQSDFEVQTYTYHYLDTMNKDSVPLGLTLNSGDLRDPSKRSTGYSKTFELPASDRNQRILRTMTADGSHRILEDLRWKKARISVNGVICFSGFARIEKSVTGNGGKYMCHILQDPSYWPELLKDKKLCELGLPTHEKTYQNVVNSWSSNSDNQNYVYPIINYGEWLKDSDPLITAHTLKQIHPAVYVRHIVVQMFSQIGYTIESDFFKTQEFKRLIVPYTSGEEYDFSGSSDLGENSDYSAHASKAGEVSMPTMPATGSNLNTTRYFYPVIPVQNGIAHYSQGSSSSVQNGYTVPFSGRYILYYKATVKVSQNGTSGDSGMWASRFAVNGQTMGYSQYGGWADSAASGGQYVFNSNAGPPTTQDGVTASNPIGLPNAVWRHTDNGEAWTTEDCQMEINLSQGDKVQVRFFGINFKAFRECRGKIKNQDFMCYPKIGQAFVPPFTASLDMALGCGTKQLDFLRGITEMFNLYWDADNEQKIVRCEPYDSFYGKGRLIDWSQKIDRKSWSDKFLIDELAKTVYFRYKRDSGDKIVERYNESMTDSLGYDKELWDLKITNEDLYRKSEKNLGSTIVSPTMRMYTGGNGCEHTFPDTPYNNSPTVPVMWSGSASWGWFNSLQRPAYDTNHSLRILNYYGLSPNTGAWKLTDDSGIVQTHNSYPYAYTYNYEHFSTSPYEDNLAWHNIGNQRGLFDKYYGNFFEKVSGGAALRTCMMDLTPSDIANFDFRDIIKIVMDGGVSTYWTVNKVSDYKPALDELTKVELIEWKYEVPSTKRGAVSGKLMSPTNYGGLDKLNPDGGSAIIKEKDRTIVLSTNGEYSIVKNNDIPEDNFVKTYNNVSVKSIEMNAPQQYQSAMTSNNANGITNQPSIYSAINTNHITGNSIALGKGLNAHDGQVVLGCHNDENPNDIFQVGSGYISDGKFIKQNAISVNENGEFSVFGGEVVAEFSTSDLTITGDVYYKDKDGNKRKVYLKSSKLSNNINKNNKY